MQLKKICVTFLALVLSGCGTYSTTLSSDVATNNKLNKAKTYCDEIPRIYAGVSYNVCLFHAEPSTRNPDVVSMRASNSIIPLVAFDIILSGVADTIVLPYSIVEQSTKGNFEIEK